MEPQKARAMLRGPTIVVHHGGDSGVEMAGKGTQGYYVRADKNMENMLARTIINCPR